MDANTRREKIHSLLLEHQKPVSATYLAGQLCVSRQIIVGDIALLRAKGIDIIATTRGYIIAPAVLPGRFVGKIACQHSLEDTENELLIMVNNGGEVVNVIVEHALYGEITGRLSISTPDDVQSFMDKIRQTSTGLLSEITGGVHLHTVSCTDKDSFDRLTEKLKAANLLYMQENT